jgi:hypothetical protein
LASISGLLAVYCSQELLEGMFSAGHPNGFAALAAQRGWVALPLAIALGLLVALALRGAAAVEAHVASHARRMRIAPARSLLAGSLRPRHAERPRAGVLASKLASRAPPLAN